MDKNLDYYSEEMEKCFQEARKILSENKIESQTAVFDIRGKLYELALELAPDARQDDIDTMHEWIKPKIGEICVDVAAGTGFLTKHLVEWTRSTVYAVDPSEVQLSLLKKNLPLDNVKTIVGSLAQETKGGKISVQDQVKTEVDFITSFGGLHHVYYQKKFMEHAEKLLKSGGRFVAGDVGAHSTLAKHFDDVVTRKCITGHTARWLSKERLEELIAPLPTLSLERIDTKTQKWVFSSKREMALFFKGLHAYDISEEEIIHDLYDHLGFEENNGGVTLNWPMLFFDIRKK